MVLGFAALLFVPSFHAHGFHSALRTSTRAGVQFCSAAATLEERISQEVATNKVVVYSKSYCPYCR